MVTQDKKVHFKAVQMLTLATLFWGVSFPVIKAIAMLQEMYLPGASSWLGTALTAFLRFSLAVLIMLTWSIKHLRHMTFLEFWQGFGLGVLGGAGILFQMDGLAYTSASTSAFLTQAYCMIIPIVVAFRDRKEPSFFVLFCAAIMMLGIAILTGIDLRNFKIGRGEWETLVGSLIFAGQILWLERPLFGKNNVNNFSFVMFATMALISLPLLIGHMKNPADVLHCYSHPSILVLTGILVVVCTICAYLMMNYWQPFVPASEAGIIYGIEPVLATVFAFFLPAWFSGMAGITYANETFSTNLILGGGLIIGANLLLQLRWLKK